MLQRIWFLFFLAFYLASCHRGQEPFFDKPSDLDLLREPEDDRTIDLLWTSVKGAPKYRVQLFESDKFEDRVPCQNCIFEFTLNVQSDSDNVQFTHIGDTSLGIQSGLVSFTHIGETQDSSGQVFFTHIGDTEDLYQIKVPITLPEKALHSDRPYAWRVRAESDEEVGPWSDPYAFDLCEGTDKLPYCCIPKCALCPNVEIDDGCGGICPFNEELCNRSCVPFQYAYMGQDDVLYVSHCNPIEDEEADGSLSHPYATIREALGHASPGTTIYLATGTYSEPLSIYTDAITLQSEEYGHVDFPAGVVLEQQDTGIYIKDAHRVSLLGLHLRDSRDIAIRIEGAQVFIDRCLLEKSEPDLNAAYGYGIVAENNAKLNLEHSILRGFEKNALLFKNASGEILNNTFEKNLRGALRFEASTALIHGNQISNNFEFGIGGFSSNLTLTQNSIAHIRPVQSSNDINAIADGIIISELIYEDQSSAGPSVIQMGEEGGKNSIEDCSRLGIILSGDVQGTVVQNTWSQNHRGAIWLQNNAGASKAIVIQNNQIDQNTFVGIQITGQSRALIQSNVISDTKMGELIEGFSTVKVGDGIAILKQAKALVIENHVQTSERIGIIVDQAEGNASCTLSEEVQGTALCNNQVLDNQYGIVLQDLEITDINTSGNTLSNNLQGDQIDIRQDEESFFDILPEQLQIQ